MRLPCYGPMGRLHICNDIGIKVCYDFPKRDAPMLLISGHLLLCSIFMLFVMW
jgi:hypothetical protein